MAYTTHGHHIEGSPETTPRPTVVARCGGPKLCTGCAQEVSNWAYKNIPYDSEGNAIPLMEPVQEEKTLRRLDPPYLCVNCYKMATWISRTGSWCPNCVKFDPEYKA